MGLLTPAEAERLVLENTAAFPAEECALAQAHGRVLRAAIHADRDLPPFDRVTMDGYALRAAAVAAGARCFQVEGVQAAGMRPLELSAAPAACVEIMTGAVLPVGADCVVPYEETTREGAAPNVTLSAEAVREARPGRSVHARGSDYAAGALMVAPGVRLGGCAIAVAASCGCAILTVSRRPKIAVVTTGDELVDVEALVAAHQVRRSNDFALRAALAAAGYPDVERFHLHDMRHEIEHQLWHILAEFDVVLLTGGVSKGKFDFLPAALETLQVRRIFQGVAQRPGKPFWFGTNARQTAVFALPGNPVSAYTCLHRYVLPALAQASGLKPAAPRTVALAEPVTFAPKLACLLPVQLVDRGDGTQVARPAPTNTSGDFAGLVGTDGFVELPAERTEFAAGTVAALWPWV
ncbi:MAG: molybdopterin molybdotransferase MoeA [Opitutales bacterium]